jgi:hypothetical protein
MYSSALPPIDQVQEHLVNGHPVVAGLDAAQHHRAPACARSDLKLSSFELGDLLFRDGATGRPSACSALDHP